MVADGQTMSGRLEWAPRRGWQETTTEEPDGADAEYHDAEDWQGSDGGTQRNSQAGWNQWRSWWSPGSEDATWKSAAPEILPDFLQGWYLLTDANLDAQERNMVQTAVQGNFGVERIAQELRTQWPEDELRRRDQGGRASSLWQDEAAEDEDLPADEMAQWTAAGLEQQG